MSNEDRLGEIEIGDTKLDIISLAALILRLAELLMEAHVAGKDGITMDEVDALFEEALSGRLSLKAKAEAIRRLENEM
jgi:hypothetical protein